MPRVKRGTKRRNSRHKTLALAKGFFLTKSKLYRSAQEAVEKSLRYGYKGRRLKKRDFRSLWIVRIGAGCRTADISYSRFMNGLKKAGNASLHGERFPRAKPGHNAQWRVVRGCNIQCFSAALTKPSFRAILLARWVEGRDSSADRRKLGSWYVPLNCKCDGLSGFQDFPNDAFENRGLPNRCADPGIGHEAGKLGI